MSNDGWPSGPRRYSISSPSSLLSSVDLLPEKRTVRSARGFLSVTTRANSAFRTSFALYVSVRFLSEYTLGDGGLVTLALFTIVGYCRLSSCYFGSPLFQGIFNRDGQHFQHQETIPRVSGGTFCVLCYYCSDLLPIFCVWDSNPPCIWLLTGYSPSTFLLRTQAQTIRVLLQGKISGVFVFTVVALPASYVVNSC